MQTQDALDFIQGESEAFGFENELKPTYVRIGVSPISRVGSRRIRNQTFTLIESNCFGRETRGSRQFTARDRVNTRSRAVFCREGLQSAGPIALAED